ncbi:MAG: GGDEF domain-containing protein [Candidatus Acetothermia bacterium]
MAKIFLALENGRNRELIREELAEKHTILNASRKEDCGESFDLVIFDIPTFRALQDPCKERVEEEKPLFLPVLLLVNDDRKEAADKYLEGFVDDILLCPIKKIELQTRVTSLLRTRQISLKLKNEMEKKALRDPLTGLHNRRFLEGIIGKEVERAKRYKHPLAFCMIDINGFKEINDRYSHMIGDEVLKELASLLKNNIRESDFLIRYGGDEFLILMPETDGESVNVVERIHREVEVWNSETDLIEVSLGIAIGHSHLLPDQEKSVDEVLKQADERMYEDKRKTDVDSNS